jgi:RNA polymerase sigma-70 factor (ECF subfamily)
LWSLDVTSHPLRLRHDNPIPIHKPSSREKPNLLFSLKITAKIFDCLHCQQALSRHGCSFRRKPAAKNQDDSDIPTKRRIRGIMIMTTDSGTGHCLGGKSSEAAFMALLTTHQILLRNFVSSLIPAIDARADIVQEINIILWQKRASFELETNFKAWAFAVARYVIMNHQKRYRRRERLMFSSEVMELLADQFVELNPEPDERMEALQKCMGRLRDEHQRLLLVCHAERGSIELAAAERGQPAVTVRSILLRLRNRLRTCIHERMIRSQITL